jgi:uncharacterized membrane protein YoaK (UPF0700 family)
MKKVTMIGLVLWGVGTIGIRLAGQHMLHAQSAVGTIALYVCSFILMALLARRIFSRMGLNRECWPRAATLLALPTLLLDPFSSAFFSSVFPNVDPGAAGVFGGWMLICCAGAMAGAWVKA